MLDSLASLPGCLPLVYRGIPLHLIDTSSEPGRRVLETYFPGVDGAAFDDFGMSAEVISINALQVGDSYKAIAAALRAAFKIPGPGLLIHPFFGPMSVIAVDTPQITLAANELRVVRISASFKIARSGLGSFLGGLIGGAGGLFGSAALSLVAAIATNVLSIARIRATERSVKLVRTAITSATKSAGVSQAAAIPASIPATVSTPDEYGVAISALHETLADVTLTPAVSPAAGYVEPQQLSSAERMAIGVKISGLLTKNARSAPGHEDIALLLAGAAEALRAAIEQSAYIDYPSRREALATRQTLIGALEELAIGLEPMWDGLLAGPAADLYRAARNLQSAVSAELDEVIGRLPDVLSISVGRPVNAWLAAQHIYGDTPDRLEGAYMDIVTRNRPQHPSVIMGPSVEVLEP